MESLVTFTELSDEEEQTGKIRQEEVEHMTAAYQYLLQYCGPKMKEVDLNFIVEKVTYIVHSIYIIIAIY